MHYARRPTAAVASSCPTEGVEIPVLARGHEIGHFVLVPTPGVGTSLEERIVAVAIADQVAASGRLRNPTRRRDQMRDLLMLATDRRLLRRVRRRTCGGATGSSAPTPPSSAAPDEARHPSTSREPVTGVMIAAAADNWIGLGLSVLLTIYLVIVLVRPEKF